MGVKLSKNEALQRYGRTEADPNDAEDAALEQKAQSAGFGTPLFNERKAPIQPTQNASGREVVLAAFSKDNGPAAEAVKKLLENPTPESAAALMKDLPTLLPDDPALAAVIAEAMAKEFQVKGQGEGEAPLANEYEYVWDIVTIELKDSLANEWHEEDHPRGGDSRFPQRFSAGPGSATPEENGRAIIASASDDSASPVMLDAPAEIGSRMRVDPKAARHFISRRNQQREKRIEATRASGDAEALKKAESMMTGEQVAMLQPKELPLGKVTRLPYDEEHKKEVINIDTPSLHIGAEKRSPSRKHRRGDSEFGVSTAFPPDKEFAKKAKRGSR